MTHEQETALHNFEALVRQLMMAYEEERRNNAKLRQDAEEAKQKLTAAEERMQEMRRNYETLRTARILEVSGGDVADARGRISKLIREVDKCIALINA